MADHSGWERLEVSRVQAPILEFRGPEVPAYNRPGLAVADRLQIQDVVCRSASCADLGDFAGAERLYTADATFDYSATFGPAATAIPRGEFWATVRTFVPGFDAIHHQLTNFVIRPAGAGAVCYSCVYVVQRIGTAMAINAGMHRHDLVRTGEGWRIRHQLYVRKFQSGDALVEQARLRRESEESRHES
jgi:hypothetical protein